MTVEYHNPELLQWRPHIFLGYELGMAIIGTFLVAVSHGPCHLSSTQYRLVPIPRARYDFACASLVFVCILFVHLLVMPRSVCGGEESKPTGDQPEGW